MNTYHYIKYLFVLTLIGCISRMDMQLIHSITKEDYGDVHGVILFDSTKVSINPDGNCIYLIHNMTKILSTYGKKKFGELDFSYIKGLSEVDILTARVITPEGKIVKVKKKDIKDIPFSPIEFKGGKFLFKDIMNKKIIFPEIDIGATVEYIVKLTFKKPLMMNKFCDIILFKDHNPIKEKVYQIEFPKEMKMNHVVKNGDIPFYKEETPNTIIYRWENRDIERVIDEPLMPPLQTVEPIIIVSNIEHWEDVSRWYYELSESTFEPDSNIKEKVKELTKDMETTEDKVRQLFKFVSKEINYVRTEAISKDKGFVPDPSALTFSRKWGVCRDKSALLISMLKEIGVDAYIVLINVSHRIPREVPTYLFEHAVVAVKREDGSFYYLDPTIEYTREYFLTLEENRDLLICNKEGDSLRYISYSEPEKNSMLIEEISSLDEDGNLQATTKMRVGGIFDVGFRGFRYFSEKERAQMFECMMKSMFAQSKVDTIIFSDFEDLTKPFEITIIYSLPDYAVKKNGDLHLITTTSSTIASSGVNIGNVGGIITEKRKYPINFNTPMLTQSITKMKLPKGYKVKELHPPLIVETENLSIKEGKKIVGDTLLEEGTLFIYDPFIPVEKYDEFKRIMEELENYSKKETVLEKKK